MVMSTMGLVAKHHGTDIKSTIKESRKVILHLETENYSYLCDNQLKCDGQSKRLFQTII